MVIRKKNRKAVTLMELLVALGISTLIIATTLLFFLTIRLSLSRVEALIHTEEQARIAISRIANELRLANHYHMEIYDNLIVDGDNLSGDAIRFQIPVGSYDADIHLTGGLAIEWGSNTTVGNYITYSLTGDKTLIRAETEGSNIIRSTTLARNVKSLIFKRENLSSDKITIQIDVQDASIDLTRIIKSSVGLRN